MPISVSDFFASGFEGFLAGAHAQLAGAVEVVAGEGGAPDLFFLGSGFVDAGAVDPPAAMADAMKKAHAAMSTKAAGRARRRNHRRRVMQVGGMLYRPPQSEGHKLNSNGARVKRGMNSWLRRDVASYVSTVGSRG